MALTDEDMLAKLGSLTAPELVRLTSYLRDKWGIGPSYPIPLVANVPRCPLCGSTVVHACTGRHAPA